MNVSIHPPVEGAWEGVLLALTLPVPGDRDSHLMPFLSPSCRDERSRGLDSFGKLLASFQPR